MKRMFAVLAIILFTGAAQAGQKAGPRVFISVDMEGIWGVVHGNQTSSDSPEYGAARKWMAEDVNAVIAGYFNVPVIMLTGDTETCAQAKSILGDELVTVAVKEAQGRYAAKNLPLDEAKKRLREGAKEALQKKGQVAVFRLNPPFNFELEVNNSAQAEMPALIYLVKRSSPRTLEFSSDDYLKGFKLLRALIGLAGV